MKIFVFINHGILNENANQVELFQQHCIYLNSSQTLVFRILKYLARGKGREGGRGG